MVAGKDACFVPDDVVSGDRSMILATYRHSLSLNEYNEEALRRDLGLTECQLATARAELLRLNLLETGPGRCLVPVSPRTAETRLLGPLERQVVCYRTMIDELAGHLSEFNQAYAEHLTSSDRSDGVTVVEDPEEVVRRLREATSGCQREAMTMQPGGGRPGHVLADARARDTAMLERGVRMRIMYQHSARADLATQSYLRHVIQEGAQVRTTDHLFERMLILDRSVAFLRNVTPDGPRGAVIVTEPRIVRLLCRWFDHDWEAAVPFHVIDLTPAHAWTEVSLSIVRLLALGHTDQVVARRLGISVRTCRRHVAELMASLHATSRFQAGVEAARHRLLDDVRDSRRHPPSAGVVQRRPQLGDTGPARTGPWSAARPGARPSPAT
jgi:DNA-binding CsgD family transcriptional regulator/sugar-specific transcriptional regulator TrmB